ncbi:lipopolysaccharide biosynthesis protein [Bacillus mycoides]|uniref:lipopolysaccharide biosynthesis protein n=1 Tax=Bacillus mycoides TaxID=1405 RepID=UPI002E13DED0|nr:oligosaccharide flippase family protein [Bacillus mycoides]
MEISSKFTSLFKNIAIFALGSIGTKMIVFLLIPLYTYTLTKSEFGYVELINVLIFIMVPIVSFQLADSVYRFLLDAVEEEKKSIISTTLILLVVSISACGLITFLLSYNEKISAFFKGNISIVFIVGVSTILIGIFKQIARGINKSIAFAATDIIQTILTAISAVYLLYVKNKGIEGYFDSLIIANIISLIVLLIWIKIWRYIDFKEFNRECAKDLLKYGLPLVPNVLAWWFINASDRFVLANYTNFETIGLYSLAFKYAGILMVFSTIFNLAWQTTANSLKKSDEKEIIFSKVFKGYYVFFVFVSTFMLIFGKTALGIIATQDYYESWVFIPLLLSANFCIIMSGFYSVAHLLAKKTNKIFYSTLIVGTLNIILNLLLVPKFGAQASAFSTFVSCLVMWIIRIKDTKKYINIVIDVKHLAGNLIVPMFIGSLQFLYIDSLIYWVVSSGFVIILLMINFNVLKQIKPMITIVTQKLKNRFN